MPPRSRAVQPRDERGDVAHADHLPQPDADPVLIDHPPDAGDAVVGGACVLKAGDPLRHHLLVGEFERAAGARLPFFRRKRRLAGAVAAAVSRRSPVGSPRASLTISPPLGFFVVLVMFDNTIARALTNDAWPLAWVNTTGFAGETASSDA